MLILKPQTWIVCESSGRWAAALRTAFAGLGGDRIAPRLAEARSLPDLTERVNEQEYALVLVEVQQMNLAEVLRLLAEHSWPARRFVALIDYTLHRANIKPATPHDMGAEQIEDVLREAGAMEVVESPRQLRRLLAFGNRIAAADAKFGRGPDERQSFADWAWSTLPWQDA